MANLPFKSAANYSFLRSAVLQCHLSPFTGSRVSMAGFYKGLLDATAHRRVRSADAKSVNAVTAQSRAAKSTAGEARKTSGTQRRTVRVAGAWAANMRCINRS